MINKISDWSAWETHSPSPELHGPQRWSWEPLGLPLSSQGQRHGVGSQRNWWWLWPATKAVGTRDILSMLSPPPAWTVPETQAYFLRGRGRVVEKVLMHEVNPGMHRVSRQKNRLDLDVFLNRGCCHALSVSYVSPTEQTPCTQCPVSQTLHGMVTRTLRFESQFCYFVSVWTLASGLNFCLLVLG